MVRVFFVEEVVVYKEEIAATGRSFDDFLRGLFTNDDC